MNPKMTRSGLVARNVLATLGSQLLSWGVTFVLTVYLTRYVGAHGGFPLRASGELPQTLGALAIEGRPLEPLRLLALASFLDSVDESRGGIRRAPGAYPILEAACGGAASFKSESDQTRDKIDPSGDVVDHASAELKVIRERLRKQRARLRSTLRAGLTLRPA